MLNKVFGDYIDNVIASAEIKDDNVINNKPANGATATASSITADHHADGHDVDLNEKHIRVTVIIGKESFLFVIPMDNEGYSLYSKQPLRTTASASIASASSKSRINKIKTFRDFIDNDIANFLGFQTQSGMLLDPHRNDALNVERLASSSSSYSPISPLPISLIFSLCDSQGCLFLLDDDMISYLQAATILSGRTPIMRLVYRGLPPSSASYVDSAMEFTYKDEYGVDQTLRRSMYDDDAYIDGESEIIQFKPTKLENEFLAAAGNDLTNTNVFSQSDDADKMNQSESDQNKADLRLLLRLYQKLHRNQISDGNIDSLVKNLQKLYRNQEENSIFSAFDLELALDINRQARKKELSRCKRLMHIESERGHSSIDGEPGDESDNRRDDNGNSNIANNSSKNYEIGGNPSLRQLDSTKRASRRSRLSVGLYRDEAQQDMSDKAVFLSVIKACWSIVITAIALASVFLFSNSSNTFFWRLDLLSIFGGPRSAFLNTQANRFLPEDIGYRYDAYQYMLTSLPRLLYYDIKDENLTFLVGKGEGVVRLRQIRVESQPSCRNFNNQQDFTSNVCYPDYQPDVASNAPFGSCNVTYTYTAAPESTKYSSVSSYDTTYLLPVRDPGNFENYYDDRGGYYAFAYGFNNLTDLFYDLNKGCWIDNGTRAVIIEFNVYSYNTDMLAAVKLIIEYYQTGAVQVSTSIRTLNGMQYYFYKEDSLAATILAAIVIVFSLIYLSWMITSHTCGKYKNNEISRTGNLLGVLFWCMLDIAVALLFIAGFILLMTFNLNNPKKTFSVQQALMIDSDYVELYNFAREEAAPFVLFGVGSSLSLLGLTRVLYLSEYGSVMLQTIETAGFSILGLFLFMVFPYLLLIAMIGYINVGLPQFNDYGLSFLTVLGFPQSLIDEKEFITTYDSWISLIFFIALMFQLILVGLIFSKIITQYAFIMNKKVAEAIEMSKADDDDMTNRPKIGSGLIRVYRVLMGQRARTIPDE